jgi:ABC-type uncharacterized transport system substrate-binding protein
MAAIRRARRPESMYPSGLMRSGCRRLLFALIGLCFAAARPAAAHPHVFIDSTVIFLFADDRIAGLQLIWVFDEMFSAAFLQDFDADGDGALGADEVAAIKENSLASLREYDYFTHLWVDGRPLTGFAATELAVTHRDGAVIYDMRIALAEPLDPRRNRIEAAIYDDSYYVWVALHHPDPVRFAGIADGACRYTVGENESRAYYYETVYPDMITLSC